MIRHRQFNTEKGQNRMARSYVPTLRIVLRTAYKYAVRWQPKLADHLSAPQLECLASTIQALSDCLVALGDATISPDA